ncbi:hypothetical protein ABZ747_13405 [Kitasatospora cineracea]|uniref:ApeA N-terminal domain 1-containing protein n=1 Tax=Kitasatospora cineracea TaxID=88074 RepID=UPI0033EE63A5
MSKGLAPGEIVSGILVDGLDGTPYVPASLIYDVESGVRVEVPYLHSPIADQFAQCASWFTGNSLPGNLLLLSPEGPISLFECRPSGHRFALPSGAAVGKIRPAYAVMKERDGDLHSPFAVECFESEIDGALEWSRMTAISTVHGVDENGRLNSFLMEVKSPDVVSWEQGNATMELHFDWSTSAPKGNFAVTERVVLRSSFGEGMPPEDHLREHRKVASLLAMCFGYPVVARRYRVRDSRFTERSLDGTSMGNPFVDVVVNRAHRDSLQPKPKREDLQLPFSDLQEIKAAGLKQWSDNYDKWARFILPSVSALGRRGAVIENIVVNSCMGLEAAGSIFGFTDGEEVTRQSNGRETVSTYIFRCIVKSEVDIQGISTCAAGLARALANNYNTIKHYDRGQFPDATQTHLLGIISLIISRAISVGLARASAFSKVALDEVRSSMAELDLYINDAGSFVPQPK